MGKKGSHSVEIPVVGIQYRLTVSSRKMIAEKAQKEGPLQCALVREPENMHDTNALKVILADHPWDYVHIGYVPRTIAEKYAPLIDKGEIVVKDVHLISLNPLPGDGELLLRFHRRLAVKKGSKGATKR